MRIISPKFKDYYDGVAAHGQTDDLVYVRTQSEHRELTREPLTYDRYHKLYNFVGSYDVIFARMRVNKFVVGFCGNLYYGMKIEYKAENALTSTNYYCYSLEDVEHFIAQCDEKYVTELWNKPASRYGWNRIETFNRHSIETIFTLWEQLNISTDYFRQFNAPCFSVVYEHLPRQPANILFNINPCLKDFGFQKVFDSYTTYQEVSMYIGGVLGRGEKETLQRKDFKDEPIIRDSKGFDKWSFKKRKQT